MQNLLMMPTLPAYDAKPTHTCDASLTNDANYGYDAKSTFDTSHTCDTAYNYDAKSIFDDSLTYLFLGSLPKMVNLPIRSISLMPSFPCILSCKQKSHQWDENSDYWHIPIVLKYF